ncbi:MAG: substrate-binding domain-containing protein [Opitutaceae bacterium]
MQQASKQLTLKRRVLVALGWNDPRTIRVIGQYARTAGWHLETRHFFDEKVPLHWEGDGLIVSYPQRSDLLAFIRRQAQRQPTVLVGRNQPGIVASQVMEDNLMAGRLAARHFLERGHTKFAWYTAYSGLVANDRYDGFISALAESGFQCHRLEYRSDPTVLRDLRDWRHRQTWLARQLRKLPRPLALYVLDDQLASETIEVCLANGWRVPEDIAVMGTGNLEIACECSHVPISSVDLGEEEIAQKAAQLLDRLMRGRKQPAQPIVIAPRGVVIRSSTDFLAVASPFLRRAVDFIGANLRRPFSLEQVAESAGVSRRTLYNLFRRQLARSPAEFVLKARLDRARQLVAESPNQTIANVASQSGLGSSRTLTRLFLRYEGVNARTWKKALRRATRPAQWGAQEPSITRSN